MVLSPADLDAIRSAFQDRVGPTALPASTTIGDLCQNLVLAIPSLLETATVLTAQRDSLETECERLAAAAEAMQTERGNFYAEADLHFRGEINRLRNLLETANNRADAAERRLKEDPCP